MTKKATSDNVISAKLKDYEAETPLGERMRVSTSEKGKTYRVKFVKVKWIEIFVELKGKDVVHAVEQLKATIENPIFQHRTVDQRWARIVAHSFPRNTGDSRIERARDDFKKRNIDFKRGTMILEDAV